MLFPTLEEFKEKAKQGNLVPVCREIIADLDTPVSAYMKIGQGEYTFLLESVEGGEKWARYCFLGCDPSIVVRTRGRQVTIETNGEKEERTLEEDMPLESLRRILKEYEPVEDARLPRFFGGAVGFISYDMVRFFEDLPEST